MSSSEPVILVDVSNTVFRCHYAFRNLSCEGQPTGALYGFIKIIHDLRQSVSKRIILCWDHGVPVLGAPRPRNWRDDVTKEYKANRVGNPDWPVICPQMEKINYAAGLLGYSSVGVMGLEADDVIGILANELPGEVLVFSTDQDFYQLLNARVQVLVPRKEKGDFRRVTKNDVETEFGIPVNRWAEFLALGGDKCDNIKPARGMGPKTAIKIIKDGVVLTKNGGTPVPFNSQMATFREKWAKLETIWPAITASFQAACLPRSTKDPRVAKYFEGLPGVWRLEQSWKSERDKKACEQLFVEFCADHELATILSIRRNLFN